MVKYTGILIHILAFKLGVKRVLRTQLFIPMQLLIRIITQFDRVIFILECFPFSI